MTSDNVVALTGELRAGLGETNRAIGTADQIAAYALDVDHVQRSRSLGSR